MAEQIIGGLKKLNLQLDRKKSLITCRVETNLIRKLETN